MNLKIVNLTKLASSAMAVLLVGCAGAPQVLQRVEAPVMISCVGEVPPHPAYEFGTLAPAATDGDIVLALARDWPRGRAYEAKLEAIIAGCL
ncbi:MAG: hypothetical protein RR376_10570 [Janthinobacterium sp.]